MKITKKALHNLVKEAIGKDKILKERPWAVEYTFSLSGGKASDSEGQGPDGFAIVLSGESGKTMRVVVDSYWNPQTGDKSGNSLYVEIDGAEATDEMTTYVPHRFDDGEDQKLIISNSPVAGLISISHSPNMDDVPVVHLVVPNPFADEEDVSFEPEPLGGDSAGINVKLSSHTNM